ncbi:MAG: prepilin-type N-terminal cleavage/methylation domain-containing protein, partial [Pseudomonadota bacterium]|nr:prepilin-type N-terminal cleavage/methylation domain-containing protein [Pseudomonadota bacterium]
MRNIKVIHGYFVLPPHPPSSLQRGQKGFTLIELSIVLLIIALIIGGIVSGQSMIRNAQLQSVITDADRYKKAVMAFRDKYRELPGDMVDATSFWGTDPGGCPSTPANATPKTATCNGNGDGFIGDSNGNPLGGAVNWYESYRIWQHLSNAGFLEGEYTGALSSRTSGNMPDPGMNIPQSEIKSNGFTLLYAAPSAGSSGIFPANYRHILVYGAPVSAKASTYNPGLTTADTLLIDQKVDDGLPGTGNIISFTSALAATP